MYRMEGRRKVLMASHEARRQRKASCFGCEVTEKRKKEKCFSLLSCCARRKSHWYNNFRDFPASFPACHCFTQWEKEVFVVLQVTQQPFSLPVIKRRNCVSRQSHGCLHEALWRHRWHKQALAVFGNGKRFAYECRKNTIQRNREQHCGILWRQPAFPHKLPKQKHELSGE